MLKIGDITVEIPVLFAPMAGVSDFPYRQLVREMDCQLVYTEMASSKGLVYGGQRTEELLDFKRGKKGLIGVQLFGSEPDFMARAAKLIEENFKPDIIDINMGCPTPKIVKNGAGSALMKEPQLAAEIVEAMVRAVDTPVTVKMRKGWDEDNINAVEIATLAADRGAKAVAVHGRTREDFYRGHADWKIIKDVKEAVDIPVIGNGDIFSPEDALKMLEETGCDGVMIARGAQGNPWLFQRTIHYLNTGELLPEPDYTEKIETALDHLSRSIDYFGEEIAIPKMRKHLAWYLKGMPHSTSIKEKINRLTSYNEISHLLLDYIKEIDNLKHG